MRRHKVSAVSVVALVLLLLSLCPNVLARLFPGTAAAAPAPTVSTTATGGGGSWETPLGRQYSAGSFAKLKKYFHHFGYMADHHHHHHHHGGLDFTDEFDDELQSAIQTYQQNFNLKVTGELDEQTMKQIARPRCGKADIVNRSTSFGHTVAHYGFFDGMPRWPQNRRVLTYGFWPGNLLSDEAKSVFARAFHRWSAVIPMSFGETAVYQAADIKIGFFSGDHGDDEPFDGRILAHAFAPPIGLFHLNLDENWVVSGDVDRSPVATAVDLESVAVHEIGHLLGLEHSSEEDAVMFPYIPWRTRKVELTEDDILGVQKLYGGNPNYNTPSTPHTWLNKSSGPHSVGPTSVFGAFLAVGFVLLLL